ncbi:MAG: RluA family pseudouridine synthase [Oscillospiraceae bacterium]
MKQFIINSNDSDQRLDKFILKTCKSLPKSMMYKFIRTKKIKVNNKRCEISQRLQIGDIVSMYINDDFFSPTDKKSNLNLNSVSTEISIVYEDENILIVDKPTGLVVHTDNENSSDTLINRIKKYLIKIGEYNPNEENSFAPALCNRLDRNTSGLVICAKNSKSLRSINQMIKDNRVHKKYLCITTNRPPKDSDTLIAYHKKDNKSNLVSISDKPKSDFKKIVTKYRYLKSKDGLHLIEVELITGRTHQIRSHMSHIGCGILGDNKYNDKNVNLKYKEKHQNLCAYSISFSPTSDDYLSYLKDKTFTTDNIAFIKKYGF